MAKKIGAIVSLSIIGVLIIATIIMANINVNYSVKCAKPDRIYVQISEGSLLATDEQLNSIVDFIDNASNQSSLTALFTGNINKYAKIVTETKTLTGPSAYYVRYKYNVAQTLKEDGKDVLNSDGKKCVCEELVFEVKSDSSDGTTKVYVIPNSETPSTYSHYYLLDADFTSLYEYLKENF